MRHKQEVPKWLDKALYGEKPKTFGSVIQFQRAFNTDEKCLQYIANLKWGEDGWQCPKCGNFDYSFITTRWLIQCCNCGLQASFISDTVMRNTRKSLTEWFYALWDIATRKMGISAMELKRQLGLGSYQTAWTWLHKIRMSMIDADREPLEYEVEADETYMWKGEKRGRSLEEGRKVLIICAVECVPGKKEGYAASGSVKLRVIGNASAENLERFIVDNVEKGATVHTDGWRGYLGLNSLGYKHIQHIPEIPRDIVNDLPRVHRVFSNLKQWMQNTHKFVSRKHLQNYLNEFTFRYNARNDPLATFNYLLYNVVIGKPRIYKQFVRRGRVPYVNPYRF